MSGSRDSLSITGYNITFNSTVAPHSYNNTTCGSSMDSIYILDDISIHQCVCFRVIINTVIIGLLAILGILGNTVSIFVLNCDRMNSSVVCLLRSLAIVDNLLLLVFMASLSIFYGLVAVVDTSKDLAIQAYVESIAEPAAYMTHTACVWMNVLIAINRYIAVCKPFDFRFCTLNKMRAQVGAVIVFALLLNLPLCFRYVVFHCSDSGKTVLQKILLGRYKQFDWYYVKITYAVLAVALPLVLLISLSLLTCLEMRRSMIDMENMAVAGFRNSGKEENRIMVIIIITFILCHGPEAVIKLIAPFVPVTCGHPMHYIWQIGNVLVTFNSSSNFIIYYVCRKSFRKILRQRMKSFFSKRANYDGINGINRQVPLGDM